MRKWIFFTAAIVFALSSFLTYTLVTLCSEAFASIETAVIKSCDPNLRIFFLLFTFATAALFLAFIISHDQEVRKRKK